MNQVYYKIGSCVLRFVCVLLGLSTVILRCFDTMSKRVRNKTGKQPAGKSSSAASSKKSKVTDDDNHLWFVLNCLSDCLVKESHVIYAEQAKKGDRVKFFMSANSKELEGTIDNFSLDFEKMRARQAELNSEKKRMSAAENTCEMDKPRKAAKAAKKFVEKLGLKVKSKVNQFSTSNCSTASNYENMNDDDVNESHNEDCNDDQKRDSGGHFEEPKCLNSDDEYDTLVVSKADPQNSSEGKTSKPVGPDPVLSESESERYDEKDYDDVSSDDKNELTLEELQLLKKIQAKQKNADLSKLLSIKISSPNIDKLKPGMTNRNFGHKVGSSGCEGNTDRPEDSPNNSGNPAEQNSNEPEHNVKNNLQIDSAESPEQNFNEDTVMFGDSPTNNNDSAKNKNKEESSNMPKPNFKHLRQVNNDEKNTNGGKKKRGPSVSLPNLIYSGRMFNHKEMGPDCVQLKAGMPIYVATADLNKAKQQANTPTAYARKLLPAVFTKKALLACSVSGQGKGKDKRPPLDQTGIDAILKATKSRCEKKHWIPQSDSTLKQKMNGKLCEDRTSYKDHALYKEAQALIKEEKDDEAEADG